MQLLYHQQTKNLLGVPRSRVKSLHVARPDKGIALVTALQWAWWSRVVAG
ncbi:hypothetical protein [Streptomyces sp. NPDC097981]